MKSNSFSPEEFPDKWYIYVTNDNRDILNDYKISKGCLPVKSNKMITSKGIGYNCSESEKYLLYKDYQRITTEQFIKHVLKKNIMEKKIIGYKLINPKFIKAAVAVEGFIHTGYSNIENRIFTFEKHQDAICKWKEAEVLDLWFEPIYEEKYKVGDWVLLSSNAHGWGSLPEDVNNKILQITLIDNRYRPKEGGRYYFGKYRTVGKEIVRKATSEEIAKAQKLYIADYEIAFENVLGIIAINGILYTRVEIKTVKDLMDKGQIKYLAVGCEGQYKVDVELINKILERLNV